MRISPYWRNKEWLYGLHPSEHKERYWQEKLQRAQRLAEAELQVLIVLILGYHHEKS